MKSQQNTLINGRNPDVLTSCMEIPQSYGGRSKHDVPGRLDELRGCTLPDVNAKPILMAMVLGGRRLCFMRHRNGRTADCQWCGYWLKLARIFGCGRSFRARLWNVLRWDIHSWSPGTTNGL